MTNLIGQSLGRYHILEQLGEGGMATVYKAYDTRLERDVAIKVIRRDAFPPSQLERILKRFEREAKSLAKLSHLHIIKVIDYGEHEGSPYLVMEYMPGGTLKQKLGKPMPWQEAVQILIPIAEALEYAHEHNIIHRDIKPSNILLTDKGQPMLTDFGIAKILETEETATLTGTGIGVGTPEYMAPEQWTGQSTTQSDIYSLGVVLYEMLTGRKPYEADTPAAILLKQSNEPLPRPGKFVNDLPQAVERILFKAMAKNSRDRYITISEFEMALRKTVESMIRVVQRDGSRLGGFSIEELNKYFTLRKLRNVAIPQRIFAYLAAALLIFIGIGFLVKWNGEKNALISSTQSKVYLTLSIDTSESVSLDIPLAINPSPIPTDTPTITYRATETATFSSPFSYTVQEGDYLALIVEKYGLGENGMSLILLLNPYKPESGVGIDPFTQIVAPGQIILLPNPDMELPTKTPIPPDLPRGTKINYTIEPGDTLAGIASKFNSSEEEIIKQNNINDANALWVGQILVIPVNLVTPTATRPPTSTPAP